MRGLMTACGQIMFEQLRPGNTYAIISWNSMFHVMKQYCLRFLPERDGLVCTLQPLSVLEENGK